jgi:hypothetical protein
MRPFGQQGKWQDREVAIKKLHLTGENPVKLEEFRNESRIMMYYQLLTMTGGPPCLAHTCAAASAVAVVQVSATPPESSAVRGRVQQGAESLHCLGGKHRITSLFLVIIDLPNSRRARYSPSVVFAA